LKASRRPAVSRSFSVEDVRTSGQHHPEVRSIFSNFYTELDLSRHLFGKFLQDVATCPDATQRARIFQVSFTNEERIDSENRSGVRPSRSNMVLFCEQSCYSGKKVAENSPNEAIFLPDAPQLESEFI
jgi:hypothetical protein